MKKLFFLFSTIMVLLLSYTESKSQQPKKPLPQIVKVDINLDGLTGSVTKLTCEKNKLNISFSIRNKKHNTCFIVLTGKVNDNKENFNITSPIPEGTADAGGEIKKYYKINQDQRVIFQANIDVKDNWVVQGGNIPVNVRAEFVNLNPHGELKFSEDMNLLGDNQMEIFVSFTGVPSSQKNYCVCGIPSALIDTSGVYIIRGNVKPPNAMSPIHSGTMAMGNMQSGLKVLIMENDAARIKFNVVGFFDEAHTIPLYHIKFETNDMFMTLANPLTGEISFSNLNGDNNQKWILKTNPNGSFGIFNAGPASLFQCFALGRPFNLPPVIGEVLKCHVIYDPGNLYQQFNLVKLQN